MAVYVRATFATAHDPPQPVAVPGDWDMARLARLVDDASAITITPHPAALWTFTVDAAQLADLLHGDVRAARLRVLFEVVRPPAPVPAPTPVPPPPREPHAPRGNSLLPPLNQQAPPRVHVEVLMDGEEASVALDPQDLAHHVRLSTSISIEPVDGKRGVFTCTADEARELYELPLSYKRQMVCFLEHNLLHDQQQPQSQPLAVSAASSAAHKAMDEMKTAAPPSFSDAPPPYETPSSQPAQPRPLLPLLSTMPAVHTASPFPPGARQPSSSPAAGSSSTSSITTINTTNNNDDDDDDDDDEDEDEDEDLSIPSEIHVFHDAENDYVPGDRHVDGSALYDRTLEAALALAIGPDRARTVDVNELDVKWRLIINRSDSNKFHISAVTLGQLQDRGVDHINPPSGKDAVDMKLKSQLDHFLHSAEDFSKARRKRIMVVLLFGDRDYAHEIRKLRRLQLFACVAIYRPGTARQALLDILVDKKRGQPMTAPVWDDIVASCISSGGSSASNRGNTGAATVSTQAPHAINTTSDATPLAMPAAVPAGPAWKAPPRAGFDTVGEVTVSLPRRVFLQRFPTVVDEITAQLADIHPHVQIDLPRANTRLVRLLLEQAHDASTPAPTSEQTRACFERVRQFMLDQLTEFSDFSLMLEGVSPQEVFENAEAQLIAKQAEILIFCSKTHGAAEAPAAPTAPATPTDASVDAADATDHVVVLIEAPATWSEERIKGVCMEYFKLHLHAVKPPRPLKDHPQRVTRILHLERQQHPATTLPALCDKLTESGHTETRLIDSHPVRLIIKRGNPKRADAAPASTLRQRPQTHAAFVSTAVKLVGRRSPAAEVVLPQIVELLTKMQRGSENIEIKHRPHQHLITNGKIAPRPWLTQLARDCDVRVYLRIKGDPSSGHASRGGHAARGGRGRGGRGRGGSVAAAAGAAKAAVANDATLIVRFDGQLHRVKEARQKLKTLLKESVNLTVPVSNDKWAVKGFIEAIAAERELVLNSVYNRTRSDASEPGTPGARIRADSNDTGDGDGGDSDSDTTSDAGGDRHASISSLKISTPSLRHRFGKHEIVLFALKEDEDDLRDAAALLQAVADDFITRQLPIAGGVRRDQLELTRASLNTLQNEYSVSLTFDNDSRQLTVTGRSAAVDGLIQFINDRISQTRTEKEVVNVATVHKQLSKLMLTYPDVYKDAFTEVTVAHPKVKLTYGTGPNKHNETKQIVISGPASDVKAVRAAVESKLRRLLQGMAELSMERVTDRELAYLSDEGRRILNAAARDTKTLLWISLPGSGSSGSTATTRTPTTVVGEGTVGPLKVTVIHGDWCKVPAAAIVNPANTSLSNAGGLAGLIESAAGPAFRAECQRLQPVPVGYAITTKSFDLAKTTAFQHVVHTVAPIRKSTDDATERQQLRQAAVSVLQQAHINGLRSIAIPGLGAGVYGWSAQDAAHEIVAGLLTFASDLVAKGHTSMLNEVVLFDNNDKMTRAINKELEAAVVTQGPAPQQLYRPTVQWEWVNHEQNKNQPYDYEQNYQIDQQWACKQRGQRVSPFTIAGDIGGVHSDSKHKPANSKYPQYMIDLDRMVQINVVSKYERAIHRRPLQRGEWPPLTPTSVRDGKQLSSTSVPVKFQTQSQVLRDAPSFFNAIFGGMTLTQSTPVRTGPVVMGFGKAEQVDGAFKKVRDQIGSAETVQTISIPPISLPFLDIVRQLRAAAQPAGGLMKSFDEAKRLVVFTSFGKKTATTTDAAVHKALADLIAKAVMVPYPAEWTSLDGDKCLVRLSSGTPEYKKAAERFLQGFNERIVKIERVQNKYLWERYVERRNVVKATNKSDANEAWMMHGTRTTDPEMIYDGQHGFDFRNAKEGMFGRGAYFAEDTSYSDGYSFKLAGGHKQMFIALVCRGRIDKRTSSDKTIVKPSPGYDSVEGMVTANHRAIITYDLHQAYPLYLITYQPATQLGLGLFS